MTNFPYLLPILIRLYTSVIVLNPENKGPEVSWSTDLSPTALFSWPALPASMNCSRTGAGRGVPGVGSWVGGWRAIPVPSQTPPGTHISVIFSLKALPTAV